MLILSRMNLELPLNFMMKIIYVFTYACMILSNNLIFYNLQLPLINVVKNVIIDYAMILELYKLITPYKRSQ